MKKVVCSAAIAALCLVAGATEGIVEWDFPRLGNCHEGMAFADGVTGVLVWGGGDELRLTLGRADLWDHRGGYPWTADQNYKHIVNLWKTGEKEALLSLFKKETPEGEPRNPYMLPLGRLVVKMKDARLVRGELNTRTGLGTLFLADGRTLEMATSPQSRTFSIRFPEGLDYEVSSIPSMEQPIANAALSKLGFRAAVKRADGFDWELPADPSVSVTYQKNGRDLGVVTYRDGKSVAPATFDAVKAQSFAHWQSFWARSARIHVPEPILQRIYDYGMYRFGAMTDPNGVPAGLQGPWLEDDKLVPWNGDYHFNINVQECYAPAFRGGHFANLKPLFKMMLAWRPLLRENARKFCGIEDGYVMPHSVDDRGVCIGGFWTGTIDHGSAAWMASYMFRYVKYAKDTDFLREAAYDFMKGTMNVYLAMLEEDKDGNLAIPFGPSPEWGATDFEKAVGRNPSFQLAACHRLAKDLISAAKMLGEEPDARWVAIEKKLPYFAKGERGIDIFEGVDLNETHRHHSHMAGIFPFDIVPRLNGENKDVLAATYRNWVERGTGLWSGWCVPWASVLHTDAGNAVAAVEMLRAWERYYCDEGHGSHHNAVWDGFTAFDKGRGVMQMDGQCAATAAVLELLVHEIEGEPQFFRGCPEDWKEVSFENVALADGRRVSGCRKNGVSSIWEAGGVFSSESSEWLSVKDAPVFSGEVKDGARAADGTSWFYRAVTNEEKLVSAKWTVSGLGVFDVFVNGKRVGTDFLKPGFTHGKKTRFAFTYDVTELMKSEKGGVNDFAAEVSAGWWRDKIVNFVGKKSAFRGELVLEYANGTRQVVGTRAADWASGVAGAVTHAAIFDGEEYDARQINPTAGQGLSTAQTEANLEFAGEILLSPGAEVVLREDLAMKPIEAYTWKGVEGANSNEYGRVIRTHTFMPGEKLSIRAGETLVADFGQNCAGVPRFTFRGEEDTVLTALPAEMLNDYNGAKSRGNDGPEGSVYRTNLRAPDEGMRVVYTFGKGDEAVTYLPRFTFFGYRYISITATKNVVIESLESVPVSSVSKAMESGKIEVGDPDLNRFLQNVYWGQLSNYLSVPTDCPQRNERLGWSADTQVFCEAGSFNADTRRFFAKFTRDLRDNRCKDGGFSSVAPLAQYGNETFVFGWADVGVIVPWTIWKHYGDTGIVKANWDAMVKFVKKLDETKYNFEDKIGYIYADWLSFETFESFGNRFGSWKKWGKDPDARNYRLFLAACYWLYDAQLMCEMGAAIGKTEDVAYFKESAARAREYIRSHFVEADGLLLKPMRGLQAACVFALKFGIVEGAAKEATKKILLDSIAAHDGCLQTGFLGTSFFMDVLAQENEWDAAYGLLLQHKNPSWLYSVDQGATTVWERWDSYTKKDGFGSSCMNSFNHYAYGSVAAWVYRNVAGIASDPKTPGFKRLILAPKPDRRLGYVKASYRSAAGEIKSAWRYEGDKWLWDFTIPEGVTAEVHLPNGTAPETFTAGTYHRELP